MNLTEICFIFCFYTLLLFVNFRPKASENQNVGVKTSEIKPKNMLISSGFLCSQGAGFSLAAAGMERCSPEGDQGLRFGADTWPQGAEAWGAQGWCLPCVKTLDLAVSQQVHLWLRGMYKAAEGFGTLLAEPVASFVRNNCGYFPFPCCTLD